MGKTAFRPWPKSRKWEKLRFGRGRRTENGKNRPSSADEMQKTMKIVCRRPTTDEKRKKMFIVGRRNAESPIFCVSNPLESQNHSISAFPTPWKVRITQFLCFQPLGKLESLNFLRFQPLGKPKNGKNRLSSTDDGRKTAISAFHPRMTSKKDRKSRLTVSSKKEMGACPFGMPPCSV